MLANTHTACKGCVFGQYEDGTQIDCWLNRINLFKSKEVEVLEVYDDDGDEFFVINKRYCVCHRTDKWAHWKGSFAEAKKQVYEEVKLQYQAIILAKDSLDDVKKTVDSLLKKGPGLAPRQITIICLGGSKLWGYVGLQKFCERLELPWRVENAAHFDMTYDKMIDIVVDMKPQPYYTVFHAGHEVDTRIFSKISKKIVHELETITHVPPDDNGNGLFVNSFVHKICGGNSGRPILEKLQEEEKIRSIGEICESA